MWTYRAKVVRVVDGDTVDVDIDLGFGIWQKNERVRIMGIDTPESRTRDKVEKKFGLASKAMLKRVPNVKTTMKNHLETPTNKPLRSRARANNTAPANKQAPRPTKLILRGVAVRPTEEWRVLAARSSVRHGGR